MTVCAVAVMTLLSGCAATGSYYGGGYYASTAIYDASCDYYTPPWGYPSDYCRYQNMERPGLFRRHLVWRTDLLPRLWRYKLVLAQQWLETQRMARSTATH